MRDFAEDAAGTDSDHAAADVPGAGREPAPAARAQRTTADGPAPIEAAPAGLGANAVEKAGKAAAALRARRDWRQGSDTDNESEQTKRVRQGHGGLQRFGPV